MKSIAKDKTVVLTPFYQQLFIVTIVGAWLVELLVVAHTFIHSYTSAGTWTIQITSWFFPVALFVLSLAYVTKTYKDLSRRLFSATLLTVVAMSIYGCLSLLESLWYNDYSRNHPVTGSSDWAAFGNDWIMMGVGLAVYVVLLFWIRRKKIDDR